MRRNVPAYSGEEEENKIMTIIKIGFSFFLFSFFFFSVSFLCGLSTKQESRILYGYSLYKYMISNMSLNPNNFNFLAKNLQKFGIHRISKLSKTTIYIYIYGFQ